MSEPILKVRQLTTRLVVDGQEANVVDQVSFDLWPGRTLSLLGESGCGKSITALSIMGILPKPPMKDPEGEVWYQGQNLLQASERQMRHIRGKKMAMIFQNPGSALNPVYTIADQFAEVLDLHLGIGGEEAWARSVKALKEVGIPEPEARLWDYPHQLSGGMKQRVMIAMALLCEPDILIADEPTTALDVTIQAQVLELMKDLQREKQMAILLITHDMGVVAEMADDVVVMYASQAVETGTVEEIFDRMAHPYTRALFKSLPHRSRPSGKIPSIPGQVPPVTQYPDGCHFNPRCSHCMPICTAGLVPNFPVNGKQRARCWLHKPKGNA